MATVAVKYQARAIVGAGVSAGLIFALFEMVAAAAMQGLAAALTPLRMIGAMMLGPGALDPSYSIGIAVMTGIIVHLVLSVAFAFVLAAMLSPHWTGTQAALAGVVFGLGLWLVNFYMIAPLAGWDWFPRSNPVVQAIAHAGFFGCPVAWRLARSHLVLAA
jgi:hypothetical protein